MILWIYSIEPPIYGDLNKACRKMDPEMMEDLGPYAIALYRILFACEPRRDDRMPSTSAHRRYEEHFFKTFLVYRGVAMKQEWLDAWTTNIGKKGLTYETKTGDDPVKTVHDETRPRNVFMSGNTSTSQCFSVALNFANPGEDKSLIPVIFIFCIHNYLAYGGFRLNKE